MAVEFKDYYQTLGVPREANQDEIRKSFRKLAREYHPDVAKDKKRAEEKFKEINEAYEVLGDPAKRTKYDTLGANWNRPEPPPGWQQSGRSARGAPQGEESEFHFGGTGFSDFFEQFFAGRADFSGFEEANGAGGRPRSSAAGPMRGQEIEGDILVTLDEAFQGSVRTISFQRRNRATGKTTSENFRVRVPLGVQEGQLIRVSSKGEEGVHGGAPGDLYLRVRFAQHPEFRIKGSDLYYDLELAPWEAVLGTTVTIPAVDGPVQVRVPAGANTGQQLRVRGKGLPNGASSRGDIYALITVQMPPEVSVEERQLWQQLADKATFKPRQ